MIDDQNQPPSSQEQQPPPVPSSLVPHLMTPASPKPKSRRRLWIILSILGCIALLIGGIVTYVVLSSPQDPAAGSISTYCKALQTGNYSAAAAQLEQPNLQGLDEQSLAAFYSAHPVSSCNVASYAFVKDNKGATSTNTLQAQFVLTYSSGQQETDVLVMSKQSNNGWLIILILFPGNCTRIDGCS